MVYSPIYYVQTNIMCILIFAIILFLQKGRNKANTMETFLIKRLIYLAIVYCISDMGAWLTDGVHFTGSLYIGIVSNIIYIALPSVFAFIWIEYIHYKMYGVEFVKTVTGKIMGGVLAIVALLTILNPLTHFAFYYDSEEIYHREIGAYILPVICFIFVVYSIVKILVFEKTETNRVKVDDVKPIKYFAFPLIIAAGIQMAFYGLTVSQIGVTFSILLLYFNMLHDKISVDELTGLNNRRELRGYLYGMYNSEKTENMFICMIDIDFFKTINDTYGHIEGDEALKNVSRLLKTVCSTQKQRYFLARYGGDEFVVSGVNVTEDDLLVFKEQVAAAVADENAKSEKPYKISLSFGIAMATPKELGSYIELLNKADERMYDVKKKRTR